MAYRGASRHVAARGGASRRLAAPRPLPAHGGGGSSGSSAAPSLLQALPHFLGSDEHVPALVRRLQPHLQPLGASANDGHVSTHHAGLASCWRP